ncbi:MAG: TIGR03915 family putative DNA repair protein [Lachnospiraceae bacterium]|nr:TIGR03915 family putative DNA repair protein [Lachnospiraceae bacterium]
MIRKIYLCEDRPESILSAVYDAYRDPVPNREIQLMLSDDAQLSLFQEQAYAESSYEKAEKVVTAIRRDLGPDTWEIVEGVLCAAPSDKADVIFQLIRYGFIRKRDVSRELTVPAVMRAFEYNRKARGEAHLMLGFTRFDRIAEGLFLSKIGPVNDVLPLIMDHFSERLNTENFVIYDEKRKKSGVHPAGFNWYFAEGELPRHVRQMRAADPYERLFKTFFEAIAIRERENPLCQRTHCPLHFRTYMTEFM